jgi:cytochrome c-type biogenesis protein CcmH/NrfG
MRLLNDARPATDALPDLQRVVNAPDPWVAYLAHLFIGRVWLAESRADLATEAFQQAVALRPTAQSARIGLATAFVLDGRETDASWESDRLLAETSALDDPWYWYPYGAYRRLPEWLHLLRDAIS